MILLEILNPDGTVRSAHIMTLQEWMDMPIAIEILSQNAYKL